MLTKRPVARCLAECSARICSSRYRRALVYALTRMDAFTRAPRGTRRTKPNKALSPYSNVVGGRDPARQESQEIDNADGTRSDRLAHKTLSTFGKHACNILKNQVSLARFNNRITDDSEIIISCHRTTNPPVLNNITCHSMDTSLSVT